LKVCVPPRLVELFTLDHVQKVSQAQLEIIQLTLDTLPDLVTIQDADSTIRMINRAFSDKTGLAYEKILGKKSEEFFISKANNASVNSASQDSMLPHFTQQEEILVNSSGEICLFDSLKMPLLDSQNVFRGTFSMSRDITRQKRREDEREALVRRLQETVEVLQKQSKLLKNMNLQLQDLATTDELTNVNNRRFFDHHYEIEWSRCCREKSPLALMICDIDHFKRYNDHYGHTTGDDCLAAVAQALRKHTCRRPGDVFARFGGEEFVGLLPNTSQGLASLAKRCVDAVSKLGILHAKTPLKGGVVTVSIGAVVGYPHLLDEPSDLLDLADQQLYLAKQKGRNTYEFLQPETIQVPCETEDRES